MKHRPQYKDKNTISQNIKHQSKEDYNISNRQRDRKRKRLYYTFRVSLPLIYKYWWDTLDMYDQDEVYLNFRRNLDNTTNLFELKKEFPGNLLLQREMILNDILS